MLKISLLTITVTTAAILLTSCGKSTDPYAPMKKLYQASPDTDVTLSSNYNFASFSGTVWKTKVKTAISEGRRYSGVPETTLIAPNRFDTADPHYRPVQNLHIITVLPVGTRLRIERLMKDNGAWGGVNVTVAVEDGANAQRVMFLDGWLLAANRYLMNGPPASTNWGVDPEMLEAVTNASK
jgi:hypothetical protein